MRRARSPAERAGHARLRLRPRVRARRRRRAHVRRDDRRPRRTPSRTAAAPSPPWSSCCDATHHDLVIIGSGSGNSIPGPDMDHLDIAIVEGGTFGGTCLNVGCIPTKMFVYPADLAAGAEEAGALGVDADPRAGAVAGHPRPHLRAHRPDLRGGPRLPPGTAYPQHHGVRGVGRVHRSQDPRHRPARRHLGHGHRRPDRARRRQSADRARHPRPCTRASRPHVRHDHAVGDVAVVGAGARRWLRRGRDGATCSDRSASR